MSPAQFFFQTYNEKRRTNFLVMTRLDATIFQSKQQGIPVLALLSQTKACFFDTPSAANLAAHFWACSSNSFLANLPSLGKGHATMPSMSMSASIHAIYQQDLSVKDQQSGQSRHLSAGWDPSGSI